MILSGRLKVTSAGEEGKETVLRIMDPGKVLGEMALLDGEPRSATLTAFKRVELLVLQRRDLLPFLEKHPKIGIKLLQAISVRLRSISSQLEDRAFLNLPNRLALHENYEKRQDGEVKIDLKVSQGDLGELVGTSRESINKQLRAWTEEGVASDDKGYITLHDLDKLEELAGYII